MDERRRAAQRLAHRTGVADVGDDRRARSGRGVQADRLDAIVLKRRDHGAAQMTGAAGDHDAHARASYS
ncbi:MAG TPA: hypothetical protein VK510_21240 [Solirubrobacteraceae bacterium]|nr:hypothetical protein [Solirubrobacteraceae bacterium]